MRKCMIYLHFVSAVQRESLARTGDLSVLSEATNAPNTPLSSHSISKRIFIVGKGRVAKTTTELA